MNRLFIYLSILFTILPVRTLAAESLSVKFGLGLIDGKKTAQVKHFGLRYEGRPYATEIGGWTDTGSSKGRKGALLIKQQVGIRPASENVYVKAYFGPALLTSTDTLLGGPLQFSSDVGVGFQDSESFVGVTYTHLSSAGAFRPNKGRDFFTLEAGIRF